MKKEKKTKFKIKKLPINIKKVQATKILRKFSELDYGGVKEGKEYIPANENRSLFFKNEWEKANKEVRGVI